MQSQRSFATAETTATLATHGPVFAVDEQIQVADYPWLKPWNSRTTDTRHGRFPRKASWNNTDDRRRLPPTTPEYIPPEVTRLDLHKFADLLFHVSICKRPYTLFSNWRVGQKNMSCKRNANLTVLQVIRLPGSICRGSFKSCIYTIKLHKDESKEWDFPNYRRALCKELPVLWSTDWSGTSSAAKPAWAKSPAALFTQRKVHSSL